MGAPQEDFKRTTFVHTSADSIAREHGLGRIEPGDGAGQRQNHRTGGAQKKTNGEGDCDDAKNNHWAEDWESFARLIAAAVAAAIAGDTGPCGGSDQQSGSLPHKGPNKAGDELVSGSTAMRTLLHHQPPGSRIRRRVYDGITLGKTRQGGGAGAYFAPAGGGGTQVQWPAAISARLTHPSRSCLARRKCGDPESFSITVGARPGSVEGILEMSNERWGMQAARGGNPLVGTTPVNPATRNPFLRRF